MELTGAREPSHILRLQTRRPGQATRLYLILQRRLPRLLESEAQIQNRLVVLPTQPTQPTRAPAYLT